MNLNKKKWIVKGNSISEVNVAAGNKYHWGRLNSIGEKLRAKLLWGSPGLKFEVNSAEYYKNACYKI